MSTKRRFAQATHACAEELLDERDHVTVDEVARCTLDRYPDAVDDERERLIFEAAQRHAKEALRRLSDEAESSASSQLRLPDLLLPASIAVLGDAGDYYYVRTDKATWVELQAGEAEREKNLARAQERLDEYRRALDRLRPFMQDDPTATVADAIERINHETGQT